MKAFLITILSLFLLSPIYSQFSVKKDSVTSNTFALLKHNEQKPFSKLCNESSLSTLNNRIDSIKYECVFIKESYNKKDNIFNVDEIYYLTGDTLPFLIYFNGQKLENVPESKISIKEMLQQYDQLKPIQTLAYSENQERLSVCGHASITKQETEKEFIRRKEIELKNTCQIQSCIDKKSMLTKVSLQTPAVKPKFSVVKTYL